MPNLTDPMFLVVLFYLLALIKWDIVKRAPLYFLGVLGVLAALAGQFFVLSPTAGKGLQIVANIFETAGLVFAVAMAVLACAGASVSVKGMIGAAKGAVPPAE